MNSAQAQKLRNAWGSTNKWVATTQSPQNKANYYNGVTRIGIKHGSAEERQQLNNTTRKVAEVEAARLARKAAAAPSAGGRRRKGTRKNRRGSRRNRRGSW
jgi:hypothetical protein